MTRKYISRFASGAFLVSLLVACGGEVDHFDFIEESVVADPGTGGAPGSGGQLGGDGDGSGSNPYRRGGFGGGEFVVGEDGLRGALEQLEICGEEDELSLNSWGEACHVGSLCTTWCNTDADCQVLGGPLEARCETHEGYGQGVCALTCETEEDCLDGMICAEVRGGMRSCVIADTAWRLGCDQYCIDEELDEEQLCGVDAECCAGLSCSPTGECQARACLPPSWACTQDGVPCCDGAICRSGYCQPE